jgi:hypothetical protein
MDAVEAYLAELRDIRASGGAVPETSGYGALATLLNDIGRHLKPRVRCFINLTDTGAGIPDGGLFVANQLQRGAAPLPGQVPQRGAIEVKAPSANAREVARGEQVAKYLGKYRQVLVTSYRDFVLVGYDAEGRAKPLESYSLASSEAEFWALASQPRKAAAAHGERLTEFLNRAMLRQAQIVAPQELAWFLASYAREARARVEEGGELPALVTTRQALEQALGMTFEGERGEHFFRSTLVQTLFYGLFAAWVFWAEQREPADTQARFRWREAGWYLHIPILSKLYGDFASPSQLGTMHLEEVLDWAGEALDRVDRASFFSTFEQQHAVQYFYEPFLEAFDPELRKQLGVWYTPPEIVKYMVARVDQVLPSELDIADGLADPRVVVLDPCCGTGTYLVEVLDKIAETLRAKGDDGLMANDLKQAAMKRVFGFEILPAPFVISHLQVGLALDRFGAPFATDGKERAGVFLTNALTGWEPPAGPKQHLLFPELEMERDAAADVKQKKPILVILGNPPYNAFAGVSPTEESGLVEPYKEGLVKKWGIRKFNLDDLYVRFFRVAERRIADVSGKGVVCFISNYSYVADPSFVVMRERLLAEFESVWVDCMNGDSRETGKRTPNGDPDPSVFSTERNRQGIRLGTAIGLFVRTARDSAVSSVHYRDFWGSGKLSALIDSLSAPEGVGGYEAVEPDEKNRFSFRPSDVSDQYWSWPRVVDLARVPPISGLQEMRRSAFIDTDRAALARRMQRYFDPEVGWAELVSEYPCFLADLGAVNAQSAREKLQAIAHFDDASLRRYALMPFDTRWCYWTPAPPLWNRPRPELARQVWEGNRLFAVRPLAERPRENLPATVACCLPDYHLLRPNVVAIPFHIRSGDDTAAHAQQLLGSESAPEIADNLSGDVSAYLSAIDASEDREAPWLHALSVCSSTTYLRDNSNGVRQDFPRIPLPATATTLRESADLGNKVATLIDTESPVDAVTTGAIRCELRPIGRPLKVDGRQIDPGAGDLAVTAGWGHAGQGDVTMPGRGRLVERAYTPDELALMRESLADLGLSFEQLTTCLGGSCVDVYLNERTYWCCLPSRVWMYTIGGYQVMKKWLSYRERSLLGRDLRPDEARYVMEMARRIAAILLLEPALDANYERVKADTYAWPEGQHDS